MDTPKFIADFKELHDKARKKTLTPFERTRYETAKTQLMRLVFLSQQGHAGKTLRSPLRMPKLLKVELRPEEGSPIRGSTIDLASGGFAVLVPSAMKIGSGMDFTLHLSNSSGGSGAGVITGRVRVASSRAQGSLFRVSFQFDGLPADAQDQLDMALIDAVLERFTLR